MLIKKRCKLTLTKITFFAAFIGSLCLELSDWLVSFMFGELGIANTTLIKGFLFFVISFGFLYIVLQTYAKQVHELVNNDFRLTIRNLQNFVFKFTKREDGEFVYTLAEGKIAQRYHRTTEQVFGKTHLEISGPELVDLINEKYQKAYEGEVVSYEVHVPHKDVILYTTLSPVFENGKVIEVVGSSSDITELKKMEEDLYKSNQRIHNILESITEGFFALDLEMNITFINSQGAKLLNNTKEYFMGKNAFSIFPYEQFQRYYEQYHKAIINQVPLKFEGFYFGKHFQANVYPSSEGVSVYFYDITEAKESEELLRKSDKLNAVGQLAAGVAHEIRNPLTALRGFVQIIEKSKEEKHRKYIEIMLSELDRIELIISEFLILAKPQAVNFQKRDIKSLIEHTITLVEPEAIMNNIQIKSEFATNLPSIKCEQNQLKQVFINLFKNSIEAMSDGGTIKVKVIKENEQQILVRITDQGNGISAERIANLGEPFYTTKEKGTGLGLMVSYKIIQNHKGSISVQSTEGKGTTVDVLLPYVS
jgi:PAS domain S-box-containing protein